MLIREGLRPSVWASFNSMGACRKAQGLLGMGTKMTNDEIQHSVRAFSQWSQRSHLPSTRVALSSKNLRVQSKLIAPSSLQLTSPRLVVGPSSSMSKLHHHQNHHHLFHNVGALSYFSSSMGPPRPPPPERNHGQPRPPPPEGNNKYAKGLGVLGAASVLFGKTKYVLAALKVTKLATLGSMVVTIGTYSMFFGLPYACGMVGLIFVHESGHALTMKKLGIPFSPMVFIPFMGATVAMKDMPRDAWDEARVAFGGPVLGSLGAGCVSVAAHATDSQLLFALADFGFMVNLFNMLPIGSMDGGRIANALSPYFGVAGLGIGGYIAYLGVVQNPLYYLILLSGGWSTFQRFYNPQDVPPNYYKISGLQRATLSGGYVGLVTALLVAMSINKLRQKPPEVLFQEQEMEKSWDMR